MTMGVDEESKERHKGLKPPHRLYKKEPGACGICARAGWLTAGTRHARPGRLVTTKRRLNRSSHRDTQRAVRTKERRTLEKMRRGFEQVTVTRRVALREESLAGVWLTGRKTGERNVVRTRGGAYCCEAVYAENWGRKRGHHARRGQKTDRQTEGGVRCFRAV